MVVNRLIQTSQLTQIIQSQLVYPETVDSGIKNIVFIDSSASTFNQYINTDSFPITFNRYCSIAESDLLEMLVLQEIWEIFRKSLYYN